MKLCLIVFENRLNIVLQIFSSLKREELYRRKIKSESELRSLVNKYIEFYNSKRPHSTINYKTPDQFEQEYAEITEKNSN